MLDDEDDMSPDDEAIGMVIPDGFRLQESRPATLENSLVKRAVLDKHRVVWWPHHSQDERIVRSPWAS